MSADERLERTRRGGGYGLCELRMSWLLLLPLKRSWMVTVWEARTKYFCSSLEWILVDKALKWTEWNDYVPDGKIFAHSLNFSPPLNEWLSDWLTGVFITTRPVFIVLFRKGSKESILSQNVQLHKSALMLITTCSCLKWWKRGGKKNFADAMRSLMCLVALILV